MKEQDFNKTIDLLNINGQVFAPANQQAIDLLQNTRHGQKITFKEITDRDVKFHRAYFDLLNYIYQFLPAHFKNKIPAKYFYIFIKDLMKKYKVIYKFKDGSEIKEYESISFSKMTQVEFEQYVREQLPFIYENIIGAFYEGQKKNSVIEQIEEEYKSFLSKL